MKTEADWRDVATSQGLSPRPKEKKESNRFSSGALPGGGMSLNTHDFSLLRHISGFKPTDINLYYFKLPSFVNLLQYHQKTNTDCGLEYSANVDTAQK